MKSFLIKLVLITQLACCSFLLFPHSTLAASRWIDATASSNLTQVLRDEIRDRIYLADAGNKQIVIIDSNSETTIKKIPLSNLPLDMTISKNNASLAVLIVGNKVVFINLNKLNCSTLQLTGDMETQAQSIAFDSDGHILVIDDFDLYGKGGWIYLLSQNGKKIINKFGVGQKLDMISMQGLIKTDLTGTILYVAMVSYSPGKLTKIDISNFKKPVFLAADQHDIGGNMRDFDISPRYDEVYVASGGTYGVQVLNSKELNIIDIVLTGGYPVSVAVNKQGDRVYSASDTEYNLYEVDTSPSSRGITQIYPLLTIPNHYPLPRGIAIERFGQKAFVIYGYHYLGPMKIQVVDLIK